MVSGPYKKKDINYQTGRPRIIKSPAIFDRKARAYFQECHESGKRPLLTGLIIALGLSSKQSLKEYELRPEFLDSVRRAKLWIEMGYEASLLDNPQGATFALRNFGWSDKQLIDIDHSSSDGSMQPNGDKTTVVVGSDAIQDIIDKL